MYMVDITHFFQDTPEMTFMTFPTEKDGPGCGDAVDGPLRNMLKPPCRDG